MKIGIVLSKTPTYSETFFKSKIKGLLGQGYEVCLFVQQISIEFDLCPQHPALPIKIKGILKNSPYVLSIICKLLVRLPTVLKYLRLQKRESFSIAQQLKGVYLNAHILTQKLDWLHFGFVTLSIGKEEVSEAIDAKMGVSFRGFDMAIYPIKHPNCYDQLWKYVDKVHTLSDDLLELGYEQGLHENSLFQKITPAINTKFFTSSNQNKVFSKKKLNILTVARLHWKKGLRDTLIALKKVKEKGFDFKYTIIGDGAQYEELVYIIHHLELQEHVFLLGKKTQVEIKKNMETCDIYLQYSISEGFCNAVLEAQAMQLLCIVSDAEGLSENVLNEKSGWVVPKKNPDLLVKKIIEVVALSESKKKEICTFARERILKDFTIESQSKQFVEFYS
jgi:colanic acid/amylovoran biosynthesis glycosyltransferase